VRLPEPGEEGRHLDGVRTNNLLENLAWGTPADNTADKMRHGTAWVPVGEAHGRSKLTERDVQCIRAGVAKQTKASLAKQFGVSEHCISSVAKRRTWAWLP
jgi:hypothetical protein